MIAMTEPAMNVEEGIAAEEPEPALSVDVQLVLNDEAPPPIPSKQQLAAWASTAYAYVFQRLSLPKDNELTIRLTHNDEIRQLNRDYRGKDKPTNVLSFPFEAPEGLEFALLGDVVISHDVVLEEAKSENRSVLDHYAHMVTHGVLHLCGYDHQCNATAEVMEALEVEILAQSDVPNPY